MSALRTRMLALMHPSALQRDTIFFGAATVLGALGGILYWKLLTLRFSAELVGQVSAAITSANFLASLSTLGLGIGLVRFLPEHLPAEKRALVRFVITVTFVVALILAPIFVLGRTWWAPNLFPAGENLLYAALFCILMVAFAWINVQVSIVQAERVTHYLVIRSLLFSLGQVLFIFLVPLAWGAHGILLTSLLPAIFTGFILAFVINKVLHTVEEQSAHIHLPHLDLMRYSLASLLFGTVWGLPAFIFPLITLHQLGAEANAGLALTWYVYSFLYIIPSSSAVALLIDGAHEPQYVSERLRQALRTNLIFLVPGIGLTFLIAPTFLRFFGETYAQADLLLRLLTLSLIPVSINGLYLTIDRVRKRVIRLNILTVLLTVTSITLSILLIAPLGLAGIGWGWLVGQSLFSLFALSDIFLQRKKDSV
jgi:O-antigen/teichoic acid export membrane protein